MRRRSYLEMLKATKGAWFKEKWDLLRKRREKIEVSSSLNRKRN